MSTRRPLRRSTTPLAAALLLATAPGQGQQAPASGQTFFDLVAVNVVNVEVYVTDEEGEPVTDLTVADFEVTEDDRPVELVNFYHVANGRRSSPASAGPPPVDTSAPAEPALGPLRVEEAEVVPESQRLYLIVYVDNFNIHPLNRNRVFSRLRGFLRDKLSSDDRVMLASYDRSLHIRHPFTSDSSGISEALFELENATGYAAQREAEWNDAVREIYESTNVREALRHASVFSNNAHFELRETLSGLEEMIDTLAGLPGRKTLLYVSDGLPMVPGQSLYQAVQQRFADLSAMGQALTRDESRRFMSVIARANTNRVSFYTIDAGGLRTRSGFSAEHRAVSSPYVVGAAIDSVHTKNLRDTLLLMANRTGGQAIYNTNDIGEGLDRFARDFGNYYSLGYRAPSDPDALYHQIEVRLKKKRSGWTLRHREGYRYKSAEAQVDDAMSSYLVYGYQTNPLDVSVDLGPQAVNDDGLVDVAIRVRIPMAKIVLLPRYGTHEGQLSIYLTVADREGREAARQTVPLELRIPDESLERAKADEVSRVISATMRPGDHQLVVAVRDEISELRSVIGLPVLVQKGRAP